MQDSTARQLLEDERARLVASRDGLQDELDDAQDETEGHSGLLAQPDDLVSQLNAREEDASLVAHLDLALRDIDDALERLDAGTYGRCEVDGEPIEDARLEALPAARYCLAHEQQQEQLGAAERAPDRAS